MKSKDITNQRLIKINAVVILLSAVLFGTLNFVTGKYTYAVSVLIAGIVSWLVVFFSEKILPEKVRMTIAAISEFICVFIPFAISGETSEAFVGILVTCAMASIYFNKKIMVIQFAFVNLVLIALLIFFKEMAYGDIILRNNFV